MRRVAFFRAVAGLSRPRIALVSACSAFAGHVLAPGRSLLHGAGSVLAVFILAAGASALNQFQERSVDARMERTRSRPLPAGLMTPAHALGTAIILNVAGLFLLFVSGGTTPFLLGILALLWYNGIYTLLKRVTAFAAVPGAIVGMIPPAIGWTSAGGSPADPRLFALCFLFFMWQVPHFWLQVLHHGKEYERAGLPSLSGVLRPEQIGRVTFIWICAAAASGLLLPLFGALQSPGLSLLLVPAALVVSVRALGLVTSRSPERALPVFKMINAYILFVLFLLSIEGLSLFLP